MKINLTKGVLLKELCKISAIGHTEKEASSATCIVTEWITDCKILTIEIAQFVCPVV